MSNNLLKILRVSQGHLEIGLAQWQAIIDRHVTNRQPRIRLFSQLTEAELDQIIMEIEAVLALQAAPPEPAAIQGVFW